MQKRFKYGIPPANNANYAFILTGLEKNDKCIFLLPNGVLSTVTNKEAEIRKNLIENNFIEAVITLPDRMFESTNIPTCIIVFSKIKKTSRIEMIDLRKHFDTEERKQKGQFGGNSHTNRIYKKTVKTISEEIIKKSLKAIENQLDECGFSKSVTLEEVKQNQYDLNPSRYIAIKDTQKQREYKDIVKDLNRVITEKNKCKLIINETLAKTLGFDLNLFKSNLNGDFEKLIYEISSEKIVREDYFNTTKNKNQLEFKNNNKEEISSILMMVLSTWKQHIYYLNTEENRYLAELRDKLLPDLMRGAIEVAKESEN